MEMAFYPQGTAVAILTVLKGHFMAQASSSEAQPFPIVFAADNVMAVPLGVCINSILLSKAPETLLAIHVLSCGISRGNKAQVLAMATDRVSIIWHEIDGSRHARLQAFYRRSKRDYPPSVYARLLLPEIIPPDTGRVLYLDVDTVVLADLTPLFQIELGDNLALACADPIDQGTERERLSRTMNDEDNNRYRASDQPYVNGGVMVLDPLSIRGALVDAMFDLMWRYPDLSYPDQDAMNIVLEGRIGMLDPRWNQTSAVFIPEIRASLPYPAELVEELLERPFIVHYTGRPKPWRQGCTHPLQAAWHEAKASTIWAQEPDTIVSRALSAVPRAKRLILKRLYRGIISSDRRDRRE